jgi:hypothetical protein
MKGWAAEVVVQPGDEAHAADEHDDGDLGSPGGR